jgi:hypothetical protein
MVFLEASQIFFDPPQLYRRKTAQKKECVETIKKYNAPAGCDKAVIVYVN